MAKSSHIYICQSCGTQHPKWAGKCEDCGEWNTLIEEDVTVIPKGMSRQHTATPLSLVGLKGTAQTYARFESHLKEFDRVCGGGLVPGSVTLVGGDPGIGKSTLLLQVTAALSKERSCIYVSGEEGIDQIRLRAQRLGLENAAVSLAANGNIRQILATVEGGNPPDVLIIDSIQTMFVDNVEAAPGTVSQVRASTQELIRVAKKNNMSVLLVGHVTKEGTIAGPRVLEHMVDTVLYFEGERGHQFRILRAVKNRFGPTDEIGVFEMTQQGLSEVANPSSLFLSDVESAVSGTVVFAGIEGTRPVLVEIQSLVSPTNFGHPRRTVVGWDQGRLSMVLAVLEARAGLPFGNKDVFLNIAGGLRIQEPGADLAVAAALISSLSGQALAPHTVLFGEIGLSGEIRTVAHGELRLKEAQKLGFTSAYLPERRRKKGETLAGFTCHTLTHITELVHRLMPQNS